MKKLSLLVSLVLIASLLLGNVGVASVDSYDSKTLSYGEYFKEERGFHDQAWNPIFDDLHIFIYTKDGLRSEADGLTLGYLYSYDFNTKEYSLLVGETVSASWLVNERIFYSVRDTIYSIDSAGKDKKIVCTADGDITKFVANDILVYYVVNDELYRYYIPSATTDYISLVPGISELYPLTNKEIAWNVFNEDIKVNYEVDDTEDVFTEYIIDVDAKKTSELSSEEWNEIVTSKLENNRQYYATAGQ
jgi:hypothetical protein